MPSPSPPSGAEADSAWFSLPVSTGSDDPLASWTAALAGRFGPVHENDPQPGFWRTKPDRQGRSSAIAIWRDQGMVHALRDGRSVDPHAIWTWCCERPIAYDLYVRVAEQGEPWPDAIPTIGHNSGSVAPVDSAATAITLPTAMAAEPLVPRGPAAPAPVPVLADAVRTPGPDSLPGETLAWRERLSSEIDALWENARSWLSAIGSILTQELADRAANFANRFAALEAQAEAERARQKKPLLMRIKAIDAAWVPVADTAGEAKSSLKRAIEPFLNGEWERALLEGDGRVVDPPAAGTAGRRIALRTETRAVLRDVPKAIRHYAGDTRFSGDAQVQKTAQRLALTDLGEGKRVPGASLVSTRRAV